MSDIDHLMWGFNAELEKHASEVAEVGAKALKAALSGLKGPASMVKRFGQRQVHGLTGWTPKGYMNPEGIRDMRAGAYEALERLNAAERTAIPGPGKYRPGLVNRMLKRSPETARTVAAGDRLKEIQSARKAYDSAQAAEDMGLTSLPGYARALMQHPGKAISTGFAEQWHGMGQAGKTLMVGLPAATVGSELAREGEPGGPGRFERAGNRLGDFGYAIGPLPMTGQIAASMGMSSIRKRFGTLVDKKVSKHIPAPPALEGTTGEAAPAETVISDRALGVGQGGFL
jgi:hypothetical protein